MAVEKLYISYNEIHQAIADCVDNQGVYENFKPTMIIAIGSGGFIPARMLRTFLKAKCGKSLPIQTIGLVLYDDNLDKYDPETAVVRKTQWLNYSAGEGTGISLQGHHVLIVDEVDDTRKTLSYAVSELSKDIENQRAEYEERRREGEPEWVAPRLGVFVVHNKSKPKSGQLPPEMMTSAYFKCMDVPDNWIVYPWDALDIASHQRAADAKLQQQQPKEGAVRRESSGEGVENGGCGNGSGEDNSNGASVSEPVAVEAVATVAADKDAAAEEGQDEAGGEPAAKKARVAAEAAAGGQ